MFSCVYSSLLTNIPEADSKSTRGWRLVYLLLLCMKHVLHCSWSISLERSYRSSHTLAGTLKGRRVSDEPPPAGCNMKPSSVSTLLLLRFCIPSHVSTSQSNPINQATGLSGEETIPGRYDPHVLLRDVKLHTQTYRLKSPDLYFISSILESVIVTGCKTRFRVWYS
jgi:hypothetical protein